MFYTLCVCACVMLWAMLPEIKAMIMMMISSKSDHPWQSSDVIAIFKMAAVTHVGFGLE